MAAIISWRYSQILTVHTSTIFFKKQSRLMLIVFRMQDWMSEKIRMHLTAIRQLRQLMTARHIIVLASASRFQQSTSFLQLSRVSNSSGFSGFAFARSNNPSKTKFTASIAVLQRLCSGLEKPDINFSAVSQSPNIPVFQPFAMA